VVYAPRAVERLFDTCLAKVRREADSTKISPGKSKSPPMDLDEPPRVAKITGCFSSTNTCLPQRDFLTFSGTKAKNGAGKLAVLAVMTLLASFTMFVLVLALRKEPVTGVEAE